MNAIFCQDYTVAGPVRLQTPVAELSRRGYMVAYEGYDQAHTNYATARHVIFQRPLYDALPIITDCKKQGIEVIVDLDDDFMAIPKDEPTYNTVGFGHPEGIQHLIGSIQMADKLVCATEVLAKRYTTFNPHTLVIPNYWDDYNPFWNNRWKHEGVWIGWAGTPTHRNDFAPLVPVIEQVLRENPTARILIANDKVLYEMLRKVPESQKLFLYGVPYLEYPLVLSGFDILLAPLRDNQFNAVKSDVKLMDSGAKGIPFVASDCTAYRNSINSAGYLVKDTTEWYKAITELVRSEELRLSLGKLGRGFMEARGISKMFEWESIIKYRR